MAALKRSLPGAVFTGLGGKDMERAGQHRVVRAEDVAVMGVTEILRHIPAIYASYRRLVASIRREKPDVAVLIDFPDVNFRLAKHLHAAGVPVIWFVSPQLWAWKRGRLRWVQSRVDRMLVIFPFEEPFYAQRGVKATFVGHPLAEMPPPAGTREEFAERWGLDPERTWVGLLPGSRWKEIRANLPALHELAMSDFFASAAAQATYTGRDVEMPADPARGSRFEFLLPVASTIEPEALRAFLGELNREHLKYYGPEAAQARLTLVTGPEAARECLLHARASVVASGTATVQAAVIGNPFVVVYRVSALTFALARKLVQYPAEFQARMDRWGKLPISMVNLIAGERVVPELLQERFTAANVAEELGRLIPEGTERYRQIVGLERVRERLRATDEADGRTAIERVATAVLEAWKEAKASD